MQDDTRVDHSATSEVDVARMDLADLLFELSRSLRSRHRRDLEPFGLTPAQARTFATIARWPHRAGAAGDRPELRLSTLAELLQIAPRSATEVVDALQDKGLVDRHASGTDRRAVVVALSPAGEALRDRMGRARKQSHRQTADDLFAVLDDDQRTVLTSLLRAVLAAQHADPASPH